MRALCNDTRSSLLLAMSVVVPAEISTAASAATPQALQCTRPSSVLWCKLCNQTFCTWAPPRVNFIIVRALFEGGVNFAQQHSHAYCGIYLRAGRNRENTVLIGLSAIWLAL